MHRTTISLPDDLAGFVAREAARRRISVSELAREALRDHLGVDQSKPRSLPFVGIGGSGQRHTARDAEEILSREWGDARGR